MDYVDDEWILPDVHREGVMRAYAEEYENRAMGLIQELGQNSFDAYPEDKDPKKMKILIKYDGAKRILSWRDFNSTGMGHCSECEWGKVSNTKRCKNKSCDWGMYHNIARSGKGGAKLGSRGLGKSLPLQSGSEVRVLTKTLDGKAMSSVWKKRQISNEEDEWHWRHDLSSKPDKWNQSGTEIRIYGLKAEIHDSFVDLEWCIKEIQNRWRKMLEKGAKITYTLNMKGKKTRKTINPLSIPKLRKPIGSSQNPVIIPAEFVKDGRKIIGEMRNITIGLVSEGFDESDVRYGIALVKNGVQTIDILRDLSGWRKFPEEIKYNIFGSVDIICTPERPFLNLAEKATHTGYRDHAYYSHVKRQINERIKKFLEPYVEEIRRKRGVKPISKAERKEAKEIKKIWNDILNEVTEVHEFLEGGGGGNESLPQPIEMEFPYVSRIEFENRKWNRGESVPIKAVIKNPIPKEKTLNVQWELRDTAPVTIQEKTDSILLKTGESEEPHTIELLWQIDFNSSMVPGMYGVRVSLVDLDGNPFKDDSGDIYPKTKMTRVLYLEEDPIIISRKNRTGGGRGKGKPKEIIKDVVPFRNPDEPEDEISFERTLRLIRWNLDGMRYKYMSKSSQYIDKKRKWLPIFEAGASEIAFEKALWDIDEGNISSTTGSQEIIFWVGKIFEIERRIIQRYITHISEEKSDR